MAESKFGVDPTGTEEALIERMTEPSRAVVEAVSQIDGEMMILGIAGKMGLTLGELLVRAGAKGVIGVSRFSNPADRDILERKGIRTVKCDLIDDEGLRRLPEAGHIVPDGRAQVWSDWKRTAHLGDEHPAASQGDAAVSGVPDCLCVFGKCLLF